MSQQKSFWKDEADYREAVESLVQHQLLNALCERKIPVCLISRVQLNSYCRLGYVENEAGRVFQSILAWIEAAWSVSARKTTDDFSCQTALPATQ